MRFFFFICQISQKAFNSKGEKNIFIKLSKRQTKFEYKPLTFFLCKTKVKELISLICTRTSWLTEKSKFNWDVTGFCVRSALFIHSFISVIKAALRLESVYKKPSLSLTQKANVPLGVSELM